MSGSQRLESVPRNGSAAAVYGAWERFVEGNDDIRGVRPEVAISWHRCRDQYRVDPYLTEAPMAVAEVAHPLEHDAIFVDLGFRAAAVAHEVANFGGIVTIADAAGRVLAEWGDKETCSIAAGASLAPWFCWSESAVGTNGMGTALGTHHLVVIRREEHWCKAFHGWTCMAVAVRDVVSKEPIAVVNISCFHSELPPSARVWLSNLADHAQSFLRTRARDGGTQLIAAFNDARGRFIEPLAAVDTSGKVVVADDTASVLLGVPGNAPAVNPAVRWNPRLPAFVDAARYASKQASHNPAWVGSTQIFTHLADEPSPIIIRPVFQYGNVIGHLISFGVSDGEALPETESAAPFRGQPHRVIGLRDSRMVLLRLPEVTLAEADGNEVWLITDQGRLRAASPGLDKLDEELTTAGFLRVHRRYVVNLSRVREVERRDRGELVLVMDDKANTIVPVSRRNARSVRRVLGV